MSGRKRAGELGVIHRSHWDSERESWGDGEPGSGRMGEPGSRGSRGAGVSESRRDSEPESGGAGEPAKWGGVVARHCEALAEQSEAIPTGLASTIFPTFGLEIIHHETHEEHEE